MIFIHKRGVKLARAPRLLTRDAGGIVSPGISLWRGRGAAAGAAARGEIGGTRRRDPKLEISDMVRFQTRTAGDA